MVRLTYPLVLTVDLRGTFQSLNGLLNLRSLQAEIVNYLIPVRLKARVKINLRRFQMVVPCFLDDTFASRGLHIYARFLMFSPLRVVVIGLE
jgi:hypothetical protein